MADQEFVLRAAAIGAPWLAAILTAAGGRWIRAIGFGAALVSAVASALLLRAIPASESLGEALMVLYSCLALAATMMIPAPRRVLL